MEKFDVGQIFRIEQRVKYSPASIFEKKKKKKIQEQIDNMI